MLSSQEKTKIYSAIKKDPSLGLLQAFLIVAQKMEEENKAKLSLAIENLQKVSLKGDKGDTVKGDPGAPGRTPTDSELLSLIKPLIPEAKHGKTPTAKELLALIKPLIPKVKNGETPSDARLLSIIRPLIPAAIPGKDGSPDKPLEIAGKLNTTEESVDQKVIKGLTKRFNTIEKVIREKREGGGGGKAGGGMGNWVHEVFNTSSATTTISVVNKVAANGSAILVRYQGQLLAHGVQYTISDRTISFTFTLQDSTYVEVTYVRT